MFVTWPAKYKEVRHGTGLVSSHRTSSRLDRRPHYEAGRRRLADELDRRRDRGPSWRLALRRLWHCNRWRPGGQLGHGHHRCRRIDLALAADQESVTDPDLPGDTGADAVAIIDRGRTEL